MRYASFLNHKVNGNTWRRYRKGVSAIPHKEGMAFDARAIEPMQRLIFQLACAVAESERTLSSECQKEDIAAARVKGKVLGGHVGGMENCWRR